MFLYNNTLHFAVNLIGKGEMYADGGFGETTRITYLANGSTGTAPGYMTPTSNGIWFMGKNVINNSMGSTEDVGWELCYTNGSPDLNQPPAKGFGYIPYETGVIGSNGKYYGSYPVVFGEINGKIIYYAQNNGMRKMYAHPGNIELTIPGFEYSYQNPFGILNDKLYIISSFKTGAYSPNVNKLT